MSDTQTENKDELYESNVDENPYRLSDDEIKQAVEAVRAQEREPAKGRADVGVEVRQVIAREHLRVGRIAQELPAGRPNEHAEDRAHHEQDWTADVAADNVGHTLQ